MLLLGAVGGCKGDTTTLLGGACVGDGCEPDCIGDDCEPACGTCGEGEACHAGKCEPSFRKDDADEPFSLILLPDTQLYTERQPNNSSNTYHKQAQWIVDNRTPDNLKFAIHLGDITNRNTPEQWEVASSAHALLDAADFPYSVSTGNHDYSASRIRSRSISRYPDYFGKTRFEGKSFYGGAKEDGNFNNYTFFESGPYRFMVLSLEHAPRKDTLCWADELIRQHPDRRVIIATHCYLSRGGRMSGCLGADDLIEGARGADTFEELAKRHSNVFMVVSGHIAGSEYLKAEGYNGNPIHQMLVDYQWEDTCTESNVNLCNNHCGPREGATYTGNGWMRKLTFEPKTNTVFATTFSVEAGQKNVFPDGIPAFFCSPLSNYLDDKNEYSRRYYEPSPTAQAHQFSFPYALTSPVTYAYDDGANQTFMDRNIDELAEGAQLTPRIAMDDTGNFVAVWENNQGISMRGFHAGGCQRFSSRAAHLGQAGHRKQPDVASDAHGNFVVVWSDEADGSGHSQIRMRGFNPDGSERFAEQSVSSVATGRQHNPRIAMSADGRFTVVWEDDTQQSGRYQVYARGFNANGSQRFADLLVGPGTQGTQLLPAVAMDKQGRSVVVWGDDSDGNGSFQVHGRSFNANGSQWLSRFTIVETGQRPAVGIDASGNFVVAWEDSRREDNNPRIYMRGYTHTGGQLFKGEEKEKPARLVDAVQHLKPSVGMNSDGAFVVAWAFDDARKDKDGKVVQENGIYSLNFNADGSQRRATRVINRNKNGRQRAPAVGLSETPFVVHLWEDDMGNDGIRIMGNGLKL